jgi:DNA-binding NtrC family response regulator
VSGRAPCAEAAVESYGWPGNIRELRNALEGAVALCPGPLVTAADLPHPVRAAAGVADKSPARGRPAGPDRGSTLAHSKQEAEVRRIVEALARHRNNRLRAAAELGISRVGLYKKLHKYGLLRTGEDLTGAPGGPGGPPAGSAFRLENGACGKCRGDGP